MTGGNTPYIPPTTMMPIIAVATALGITAYNVKKLVSDGKLEAQEKPTDKQKNKKYLFSEEAVEKYAKENGCEESFYKYKQSEQGKKLNEASEILYNLLYMPDLQGDTPMSTNETKYFDAFRKFYYDETNPEKKALIAGILRARQNFLDANVRVFEAVEDLTAKYMEVMKMELREKGEVTSPLLEERKKNKNDLAMSRKSLQAVLDVYYKDFFDELALSEEQAKGGKTI